MNSRDGCNREQEETTQTAQKYKNSREKTNEEEIIKREPQAPCVCPGGLKTGQREQNRNQNPNSTTSRSSRSSSLHSTMAHHEEDHSYHPKDALSAAMKATALTGGVGLFASAVQNTLTKQNVGPLGVFMRTGGTIGVLGMSPLSIEP